jgi:hypothetical protein
MLLFLIINLQFKGLEINRGNVNEKKETLFDIFNKILIHQIKNYLYFNNFFYFLLTTC